MKIISENHFIKWFLFSLSLSCKMKFAIWKSKVEKASHTHAFHCKAALGLGAKKTRYKVKCTLLPFTFPPRFSGTKNNISHRGHHKKHLSISISEERSFFLRQNTECPVSMWAFETKSVTYVIRHTVKFYFTIHKSCWQSSSELITHFPFLTLPLLKSQIRAVFA